ncbi:MAG: DUF87 domain-containing protein [Candidatus Dadabacteria bacterium]|nr:DUF87 domain-containing protein [Candidatus Dadabacteria bacterium]
MVGDLLALDYDEADVLVHDHMRQKVGGLPMGCFLLSTRLVPVTEPVKDGPNAEEEDTALILLRVIGRSRLSNHADTEKYRLDAALRSIDSGQNWDAKNKTDQFTLNQLRHAGIRCSVLGTFRMRKQDDGKWHLGFGADISNFYSGQGMKVYKPMGESLRRIVNFVKPTGDRHPLAGKPVEIGRLRYSSSEIAVSAERENVSVGMDPTDLLARRTALFGMSRSGKSNTIKTVSSAIFKLRADHPDKGRVGQLIFDVNGEYCNDNPQDSGCLCTVWRSVGKKENACADVVTYGLHSHPNDKSRRLMKVNFFGQHPRNWSDREEVEVAMDMLLAGKTIIDESLRTENAGYVKSFRGTNMDIPMEWDDKGTQVRYKRCVAVYRALLVGAGFSPPKGMEKADISDLFGESICDALKDADHKSASETLKSGQATWSALRRALESLQKFLSSSEGKTFNKNYSQRKGGKGKEWSDDQLNGLLEILNGPAGLRYLRLSQVQHDASVSTDYATHIVENLVEGKLVIVDQSTGAPDLIQRAAERIMWELFNSQKDVFISPRKDENGEWLRDENGSIMPPPDVIVYAEEAHNLLPAKDADLTSVWARIAKEGSKFRIGLVYSTQEPSSILANILKNTDNWFVAHLNNRDETRELRKYYDFEMFEGQILKVPDTGFLRMRCLSNPYIVPIQVNRFMADTEGGE